MKRQQGFTLMELMVAVAIIGILVAMSVPSYQRHVLATHRGMAAACLVQYSQFMERVYTSSMAYDVYQGQATSLPETSCRQDLAERYQFNLVVSATQYNLEAAPIGAQLKDVDCGALQLFSTGKRMAANQASAEIIKKCW